MSDDNFVPGTTIPKPRVKLVGEDGNAFSIMGRVARGLKRAKVPREVIEAYQTESMSGDYDNLLSVAMKYIDEGSDDYEADED